MATASSLRITLSPESAKAIRAALDHARAQMTRSKEFHQALTIEKEQLQGEQAKLETEILALQPKALTDQAADDRLAYVLRRLGLVKSRVEAIEREISGHDTPTMSELCATVANVGRLWSETLPERMTALWSPCEPDYNKCLVMARGTAACRFAIGLVSQATQWETEPISDRAPWAFAVLHRALRGQPDLSKDEPESTISKTTNENLP